MKSWKDVAEVTKDASTPKAATLYQVCPHILRVRSTHRIDLQHHEFGGFRNGEQEEGTEGGRV